MKYNCMRKKNSMENQIDIKNSVFQMNLLSDKKLRVNVTIEGIYIYIYIYIYIDTQHTHIYIHIDT